MAAAERRGKLVANLAPRRARLDDTVFP
jgi:hypothetical protein